MEDKEEKISKGDIENYLVSKNAFDPRKARRWLEKFWIDHKNAIISSTEKERDQISNLFSEHGMERIALAINPEITKVMNEAAKVFNDPSQIFPHVEKILESLLEQIELLGIPEFRLDFFYEELTEKLRKGFNDPDKTPLTLGTLLRKAQKLRLPQEKLDEFNEIFIEKWQVFLENLLSKGVNVRQIETRINEARDKYGIPEVVLAPFEARLAGNWEAFLESAFALPFDDRNASPRILREKLISAQASGINHVILAKFRRILIDRWERNLEDRGILYNQADPLGIPKKYKGEVAEDIEMLEGLLRDELKQEG